MADPMASPSDIFIDQFKTAAGEGAVLELKMRLLANKVPELQPYVGEKLEDVEEQIISLIGSLLLETEPEHLRLCRQLRNKVLHCDFPRARAKLHELGAPNVRGNVRQIRLTNTTGEGLLKQLTDAVANKPGSFQHVADLTSKGEANVYGWLIELGVAGDFIRAAGVFRKASAIIERLIVAVDQTDE
jgi:hypothetical protein